MDKQILKKHVLVADDAEHIANDVKNILSKIGFKNISTASNGKIALDLFKKSLSSEDPIELILSDLYMPEMGGLDLLKEIRKEKNSVTLPFLIYTSVTNKDEILNLLKHGANNYIIKPAAINDFIGKISSVFDHMNGEQEGKIDDYQQIAQKVIDDNYDITEKIIACTSDFISVISSSSKIIRINQALCDALDIEQGRVIGLDFSSYLDKPIDFNRLENLKELRVNYKKNNGELIPVLLSVTTLFDDRDHATSYILFAKDHRLELALQEKLSSTSKMASLGEMIGGISHEINNPLAIISGKINSVKKLLQKEEFDKDVLIDRLTSASSSVKRIAHIVKLLKEFAINDGLDEDVLYYPSQIIDKVKDLTFQKIEQEEIKCSFKDNVKNSAQIMVQESQLVQVMIALVSNSIYALKGIDDRWMKVEIDQDTSYIIFKIQNSGPVISEDIKGKIFDPFFTTKPTGDGAGLGLSSSQGIIKSHNGQLYLDDCEPTTFVIKLPKV